MQKIEIFSSNKNKIDFWDDMLTWLKDDFAKVNNVIMENMNSSVPLISQLAGYIISSGGKRIRPLLTLSTSKLCQYNGLRHVNLAACIEFIHTATLLHDDVVDESKKRRGKASANYVWNNKSSILVGDFLLSKAFRLMIKDGSDQCLEIISKASVEISQGEVLQLESCNQIDTPESNYLKIIEAKTASLFCAACTVSGIISKIDNPKQQALNDFGKNIGMAFQITDDTLDYCSNDLVLGKNTGDDFREGKVSLPVILAYKRSNKKEKEFWTRTINNQNQNSDDFILAKEILRKYNVIEDCFLKAQHYSLIARDSLSPFENNADKEKLLEMCEVIVKRQS